MTTRRPDAPNSTIQDDEPPPASGLSSMQRAILTIQKMRTKIESLERTRVEPIAIIGIGCRFPGGANSPEAYFKILEDGVDAIREVPPERWRVEHEGPDSKGDVPALRWGSFLDGVDRFDAAFFGISPREAESLDPQQRLLLEVSWEAFERAGQLPERLMGSRTGVFIGIWALDYQQRVLALSEDKLDAYCFTGNVLSTAAGRIAYSFGLQGPCISVETACSSSLTAMHLACQSLRNGECNIALAGGVNLMLSPTTTMLLSKTQALSPDGRCKAFDSRANGFVRGEGCGILILKRLADAERDGDSILALIRGSAVNQDGRSTGLTAPNVLSQQALLKQALENARVAPSDMGYIEAHGTGTSLGDPIEVDALKAVFGGPREKGSVCVLGAVKTNIGHLEAAAGVAGVIKVVLSLQNEKIPGNLHFRALNPRIDLRGTSLAIAQEAVPWRAGIRPRFAGVSGFGISGTNAHVVLEEAPRNLEEPIAKEASAYLLPISTKSKEALDDQVRAYHAMLTSPDSPRLLDIVYTASSRRSHFEHRFAAVGGSKEELAAALDGYLRGEAPAGVSQGKAAPARAKVVFVFSGQGSQWIGMGKKLYDDESAFRSVIDSCDALLMGRLGWSLLDELDSPEHISRIGETQVAQPLIFAIQIALVELLRSWGISPDAVIGHSVGEIAAAHIAGILSLDEAIRLVAIRGRIMQKATGLGKMISVSASLDTAKKAISGYEGKLSIAAVNDPGSIVLAGDTMAMDEVQAKLERQGVVCRPLRVNYAFHSPQMEPLAAELVERLTRVDARRATLAMYSTVLSECVDGKELDVRYWGRNIRETVNLAGAVDSAIHDGYQLFLEVGPHPVLTSNVQQCLSARKTEGLATYSLRRNQDDRRALLAAAAELYTRGCAIEWPRVVPAGGRCVALPAYPWRRERYWVELQPARSVASSAGSQHPLLGNHISSSIHAETQFWEQELRLDAPSWIAEHLVQGVAVFPGAGYVEMALSVAGSVYGDVPVTLFDLSFEQMLSVTTNEPKTVQFVLTEGETSASFRVASRGGEKNTWTTHATGSLRLETEATPQQIAPTTTRTHCAIAMSSEAHYQHMERRGVTVGPSFQGIEGLWIGDGQAVALVRATGGVRATHEAYRIHPAFLDACFQVLLGLIATGTPEGTYVPMGIEQFRFHRALGDEIWIQAKLRPIEGQASRVFDMAFMDANGNVAVELFGLRVQRVNATQSSRDELDECLFKVDWAPKARAGVREFRGVRGKWLVFRDQSGVADRLIALLRERGDSVAEVVANAVGNAIPAGIHGIDPQDPTQYSALLEREFGRETPCVGVVYLFGLDETPFERMTNDTLSRDISNGVVSAAFLTQAILRQNWRDTPRLILVTRGAQRVGDDQGTISVAAASLSGFGRTLALEHPSLECSIVDLAARAGADDASRLLEELASTDREGHVALRNQDRFVARLVRTSFGAAHSIEFALHADATYLVTGGLGGLGLSIAKWLGENGARYIVLWGRKAPSEGAREAIAMMEQLGAKVVALEVDVSRAGDVEAALARMGEILPPLRGVVHAAGVIDDRTLVDMTGTQFDRVFAPKARGAFNLHVATLGAKLDFFVMYSSAAALVGSPGQANYAAANAFMDALARARAGEGLPALSIQWGPFSDVGMAAAQNNRGERLSQRGLEALSPAEGLRALWRLLERPRAEIGVLRLMPRQWLELTPQAAGIPFFALLSKERAALRGAAAKPAQFREKLERTPEVERGHLLESLVLEQLGRVLHIEASRIDAQASFTSIGVDSLMSLELRNKLEAILALKLPATILFTYANVRSLCSHLLKQIQPMPIRETNPENVGMVDALLAPKDDADGRGDIGDDDLLAAFDASIQDLKPES